MTTAPPTEQERLAALTARVETLAADLQGALVDVRRTLELARQDRVVIERLGRRLKERLERVTELERQFAELPQVGQKSTEPADPEPLRQEIQTALGVMRADVDALQAEARNTLADVEARAQRAITSVNLLLKGTP